jgi:hypothetical protein
MVKAIRKRGRVRRLKGKSASLTENVNYEYWIVVWHSPAAAQ